MTTELLEKLIDEDFGYSYSTNWGKSETHSSLVVDRRKGKFFWNSMGISGTAKEYLKLVRHYSDVQVSEIISRTIPGSETHLGNDSSLPYDKLIDFLWMNGESTRDYWYHRGLTDNTINRFRLGFYNDWFILPVFVGGELQNFQCRREIPTKAMKAWYSGKSPYLFNSDILQFTKRVFVTEGPVDAILLSQLGLPAVSHTGGASYWNPDWFKNFYKQSEIIYIADNDKVGIEAAKKVAKSLGEQRVRVLRFSDKTEKYDTVDFFRDGGTLSEFNERVLHDCKYSFEGLE